MMSYVRSSFVVIALFCLVACQPADQDSPSDINKQSVDGAKKVSIYLPQDNSVDRDIETRKNLDSELVDGLYRIENISYDELLVLLQAKNASVKKILLDLADEYNFIVKSDVNYDTKVTIDTRDGVAIESVFRSLLDGHQYSIKYKDLSESAQPEIDVIFIGEVAQNTDKQYNPLRARVVSSEKIASDLAIDFPFSSNAITIKTYNDSGSFVYDDVGQLLSQSPFEETIDFVNQINLDSTGLRTLAEIFHQSDNPEIRAEVLSSLSSSDSFAAKWLTLNALKDIDEKVVLTALEEVSLWLDPATVSYVEPFQNSSNPEIRKISQEIIETNSDVSTESFSNLSQEERSEAAKKKPEQLYREQLNRQKFQEKILEMQKRQSSNQ